MEFFDVIKNRRSIREYTTKPVPADVVEKAINAALLAPNSSNMQTWEFYWVQDSKKKAALVEACLNQTAARTAQELIVVAANPSRWKNNAKTIAEILEKQNAPAKVIDYYRKLMPFLYGMQFLAPIKFVMFNILGLFKPTPRHPWSPRDRMEVCIKSAALACENLMLAITAQGFDTCPMEGFDESRVAKVVDLKCGSRIVMVISIGERDAKGVWGEQLRLPKENFVKKI